MVGTCLSDCDHETGRLRGVVRINASRAASVDTRGVKWHLPWEAASSGLREPAFGGLGVRERRRGLRNCPLVAEVWAKRQGGSAELGTRLCVWMEGGVAAALTERSGFAGTRGSCAWRRQRRSSRRGKLGGRGNHPASSQSGGRGFANRGVAGGGRRKMGGWYVSTTVT